MFGPQAFFMNKKLKINKGFFVAILSAYNDLDASINEQLELRNKESQLLPILYFTCLILLLSQVIEVTGHVQKAPYLSCLLYTSPSPRDGLLSRMPSSA